MQKNAFEMLVVWKWYEDNEEDASWEKEDNMPDWFLEHNTTFIDKEKKKLSPAKKK